MASKRWTRRLVSPLARWQRYWLVWASIFLLALLAFVVVEVVHVQLLADPSSSLRRPGPAAALTGIALLVADVVVPVPSSLVMFTLGAIFGPLAGSTLSLAGSVGASLVGFTLGRMGDPIVRRLVPPDQRNRADRILKRWGPLALVVTRPVPLLAETTAVVAGTSSLGWRRVFLAALAGSLPLAVSYSLAGAVAMDVENHVIVFVAVILIAAVVWFVGSRRGLE